MEGGREGLGEGGQTDVHAASDPSRSAVIVFLYQYDLSLIYLSLP
jgi:hypothetical protein